MTVRHRAPALVTAAAWVAGILLADSLDPPPGLLAATLAAGILFLLLSARKSTPHPAAAVLFLVILGGALHGLNALFRAPFPFGQGPAEATVTGMLAADAEGPPGARKTLLDAASADTAGQEVPVSGTVAVTLRWRDGEEPDRRLRAGMQVRLRGRLERPPRARNPGEFDLRSYYEANGIGHRLTVRRPADVVILDSTGGSLLTRRVVWPLRRSVLGSVDRLLEGEEGALLKGILLGERTGISREVREAFTVSGTAHVLAVSGSNVAVVAGAVFLFLGLLRAGRRLRAALTAGAVLLYMLVTGSQPPVVRAALMALVLLAADATGRPKNTLNALGVAAMVMLCIDTRQVFDVGFQLSFAAVLSLVLLTPLLIGAIPGRRLPRILHAPLRAGFLVAAASAAVTLGTLPLTAVHFGRVSVIGLAANILVVPLVGAGVVIGGIMAAVEPFWSWGGEAYAALARIFMKTALWCTTAAAHVPWASADLLTFRPVDAIPYYMLLLLAAAWRRALPAVRVLLPASLAAAGLALFWPDAPAVSRRDGVLRVTFLDVGQGDAILVEPPGRAPVLIDAGPWSPEYDAGRKVVVPYLRRRGIRRLGMFLPTHAHADHLGGAAAVLRAFPVDALVWIPQSVGAPHESLYHAARAAGGVPLPAAGRAGEGLLGDSSFALEVLWSPSPFAPRLLRASDPAVNEGSLVCRVRFGEVTFLFTGDAGGDTEERLVRDFGPGLRADVLKVAHHGSATATTAGFLEQVRPATAVISVGSGNRFGHPSPLVVDRLTAGGAEVFRTDRDGAVILESDGRTVTPVEWR